MNARGLVSRVAIGVVAVVLACRGEPQRAEPSQITPPPQPRADVVRPQPSPAEVVATVQSPLELAAVGERVFVISSDRFVFEIDDGGDAKRVANAPPIELVSGIIGGRDALWLLAYPLVPAGTAPRPLSTVVDGRSLWRIPLDGSPATEVANDVTSIVAAGDRLVLVRGREASLRETNGSERPLGSIGERYQVHLTAANRDALFVARGTTLFRVPFDGSGERAVGALPTLLGGLAVDDQFAYASGDGGVVAIALADGTSTVRAHDLADPRVLAVDGKGGVYVMTYGTSSGWFTERKPNRDGELLDLEPGQPPVVRAGGFVGAGRVLVTPSAVLVTDTYGHRVLRARTS